MQEHAGEHLSDFQWVAVSRHPKHDFGRPHSEVGEHQTRPVPRPHPIPKEDEDIKPDESPRNNGLIARL